MIISYQLQITKFKIFHLDLLIWATCLMEAHIKFQLVLLMNSCVYLSSAAFNDPTFRAIDSSTKLK